MERGFVMTSEILVRRYDKAFSLYDSDKNGYVEAADLKRFRIASLGVTGKGPQAVEDDKSKTTEAVDE
jgi:Ca2+-binding EF-hand superfamily protein